MEIFTNEVEEPMIRRRIYQDSRWMLIQDSGRISDAEIYTRIAYNDNITIIYTKISVMKTFIY